MVDKRGDIQMSFGMIFSIIIIAATIAVAIYAITLFMNSTEKIKYGTITKDIEEQAKQLRQAEGGSKAITLDAPRNVEELCFVDLSKNSQNAQFLEFKDYDSSKEMNFFFYPIGEAEKLDADSGRKLNCGTENNYIDCFVFARNPLCIPVEGGRVKIRLTNPGNGYINISQAV